MSINLLQRRLTDPSRLARGQESKALHREPNDYCSSPTRPHQIIRRGLLLPASGPISSALDSPGSRDRPGAVVDSTPVHRPSTLDSPAAASNNFGGQITAQRDVSPAQIAAACLEC